MLGEFQGSRSHGESNRWHLSTEGQTARSMRQRRLRGSVFEVALSVRLLPSWRGRCMAVPEKRRPHVPLLRAESQFSEAEQSSLLHNAAVWCDIWSMRDATYYKEHLAAERLQQCYQLAPPRVEQYLRAEVEFVVARLRPDDVVLDLGCGYGRTMPAFAGSTR